MLNNAEKSIECLAMLSNAKKFWAIFLSEHISSNTQRGLEGTKGKGSPYSFHGLQSKIEN